MIKKNVETDKFCKTCLAILYQISHVEMGGRKWHLVQEAA